MPPQGIGLCTNALRHSLLETHGRASTQGSLVLDFDEVFAVILEFIN
jgi:hypothetical protein